MVAETEKTERARRGGTDALTPLQSLYGESPGAIVDFIHIEPLRDRSEQYNWSIDAHTHAGLHQVVLLSTGGVQVSLDEVTHDVVAPAVVAIPANVVHSFEYEPHSSGFVLAIADRMLGGSQIEAWLRTRLFDKGIILPLDPDDALVGRLDLLATEIIGEQATIDTGRLATVDWLTRTLLVLLARRSFPQSATGHQGSDLLSDFRSAIEAHFTEHWRVKRFAEHLHVSESSLNRMCQTVVGTTAFEMVQGRLEIEARRRLIYSTAPIHRIAGDLGFADPSYFARFFRRRTGLSPRGFRAQYKSTDPVHRPGGDPPEPR